MFHSHRRPAQAAFVVLTALAAVLLSALPAAADPGSTESRSDLALDWLAAELAANDGLFTVTFGTEVFPDQGLTIDAILAEVAGGRGTDPIVTESVDAVDEVLGSYIGSDFGESYAGATAKALFLQQVLGHDLGGATDLDANLRALIQTSGDQQGRFSDESAFGDFSNGIGQAIAILALDRTSGGVPADALTFLLDQQCSDGSFRLNFGATASCAAPSEGDADATAFALSSLLTQPSSAAVDDAITAAVDRLIADQEPNGGFVGTGAVNSNTTGLAAAALRAAGEGSAADAAARFLAGLQLGDCADDDFGAIAYDQSAFAAGIEADRAQWTRATAQGALGLGLPAYGGIGSVPPVTAGLDDVTCPAVVDVVPKLTSSASSITAGGTLTLEGVGFAPGETVDVTLHSAPVDLGSFTADEDGAVAATVTIPAHVEPGLHTIAMVGRTSGTELEVSVEVLAAAAAPGDPVPLPATGSHTGELTVAAVALVAAGWALVFAGRRRAGLQAS